MTRFGVLSTLLLCAFTIAMGQDKLPLRSCRVGARSSGHAQTHRAERMQVVSAGGDFYHGQRRQLVVLVEFRDRAFQDYTTTVKQEWDTVFNCHGLNKKPFVGSVHDYFSDQSYGQLDIVFDLLHIALPDSVARYRSTATDDNNSRFLVSDVVDVLQDMDMEWDDYDWNGDGYVNQLMILFAGKGQNDGGGTNSIWPHQWWLTKYTSGDEYCQARKVKDTWGRTFWIDSYCVVPEIANNKVFGSFGTICHEYTHCFGFPDFYGFTNTPRQWDLMDYGNNNGDGFSPPSYSAHERWLMGWLTPTELTTDVQGLTMAYLGEEPRAYIIRNEAYEQEYYLVENRQQVRWDTSLPGNGILVFHIDFDEKEWTSTLERTRYAIIPANNKSPYYYSKGWAYPYEDNNELTNLSQPAATLWNKNADNTFFMNKPLTDMTVDNGVARFNFMNMETGIKPSTANDSTWKVLLDWGPIRIVQGHNGEVRKIIKR